MLLCRQILIAIVAIASPPSLLHVRASRIESQSCSHNSDMKCNVLSSLGVTPQMHYGRDGSLLGNRNYLTPPNLNAVERRHHHSSCFVSNNGKLDYDYLCNKRIFPRAVGRIDQRMPNNNNLNRKIFPKLGALAQQEQSTPDNTPLNSQQISIPILFENDDLLAICKPPHIPHHDDPSTNELGILSIIRQQQQRQQQQSQAPSFPYPHRLYGIHRLDRATSGILLLAKSPSAANLMVDKFRNRQVTKYYIGISGKKPKKKKQGWVKGMMVMGRRGSYKLIPEGGGTESVSGKKEAISSGSSTVDDDNNDDEEVEDYTNNKRNNKKKGGYAVTRFFTAGLGNLPLSKQLVLSSSSSSSTINNTDDKHKNKNENNNTDSIVVPKTAILFQPHTGKTHQLRVAAKSVGLPLLGDGRYSGGRVMIQTVKKEETSNENANSYYCNDDDPTVELFDRTYLHASVLHFEWKEDEYVTIWSPPPFDKLFAGSDDGTTADGSSASSELMEVLIGMMEKHCDCAPILEAIREKRD